MELKDLNENNKLFEVIAGSVAYGTNTPESDLDIRGVFMLPEDSYKSLLHYSDQVNDKTNDITFYELKKFLRLASDCNPNIIELLWTPEDCIVYKHPMAKALFENRDLFISKKAYHTFSGYAYSQIKRAKGQNKWVNNPQPINPPDKLDFCWYLDVLRVGDESVGAGLGWPTDCMPCRPILLKDADIDPLTHYNCAKMEHIANTYRLYHYGSNAKGVFRGDQKQLVVESIPKKDEWPRFAGLLIFNEVAYNKAHKDWKNYHDWLKNRNEARYRSQEAGEIDYDAKNLMHCMRLLWSGGNILRHGVPIVRFEGEQLEILMNIRKGLYTYDKIMGMVEKEKAILDDYKEQSSIPDKVDMKAINKLFRDIG